jgi:hypothetical protein
VRTASAPRPTSISAFSKICRRDATIEALINLAPGVTRTSGFGGTQGSNALYVDGVDITVVPLGNAYLHFQPELVA